MTDDKKPGVAPININQAVNDLIKNGPSLKIRVAPVPFAGVASQEVWAQIDTGAERSGIRASLVGTLGLQFVGRGGFLQAGRSRKVIEYHRARLILPAIYCEVDAIALTDLGPPHDVVIGRDILKACRIDVDFTRGTTSLHFKATA